MTHPEKSRINQMRAWPYRQECRDHGPSKKNLFYWRNLLLGKVCKYKLLWTECNASRLEMNSMHTILKATGNMSCTRCCRNLQDSANKKVVFCFGTSGCRDGRATHATEAKCLDDAIRGNHQGHQFAEKGLRLTCCVQLSLSHRPVLLQCSTFRLQCSCSYSKGSCVPVIMLMLKNIERCGRISTSICRTPLGTASLASSNSSIDFSGPQCKAQLWNGDHRLVAVGADDTCLYY